MVDVENTDWDALREGQRDMVERFLNYLEANHKETPFQYFPNGHTASLSGGPTGFQGFVFKSYRDLKVTWKAAYECQGYVYTVQDEHYEPLHFLAKKGEPLLKCDVNGLVRGRFEEGDVVTATDGSVGRVMGYSRPGVVRTEWYLPSGRSIQTQNEKSLIKLVPEEDV